MPEQRFLFDDIAETYARVRPGYPAALFDTLVDEAGLSAGARLLEIGSGSGIATAPFVVRGFSLVCIEPGAQLGAFTRRRFSGERVEVVTATFEQWPAQASAFDMVFAAQSFHWVDPELRFAKARDVLKPHGTLAVFGNRPESGNTDLDHAIQQVYREHAPELQVRAVRTNNVAHLRAMFDDSGLFETPKTHEFPWLAHYRSDDYVRLLSTHSDHRMLDEATRVRLLNAMRDVIEHHGGTYEVPHVAALCHARRR